MGIYNNRKTRQATSEEKQPRQGVYYVDLETGKRYTTVPSGYQRVVGEDKTRTVGKTSNNETMIHLDDLIVTAPQKNRLSSNVDSNLTTPTLNKQKPLYEYTPAQQHVNNIGTAQAFTQNVGRMYDGKSHPQYEGIISGMNDVGNAAITIGLTGPLFGKGIQAGRQALRAGAYKSLLKAIIGGNAGILAGNKLMQSNTKYGSIPEYLQSNGFNSFNSMMMDPSMYAGGYFASRFRPVRGKAYVGFPEFEKIPEGEIIGSPSRSKSVQSFQELDDISIRGGGKTIRKLPDGRWITTDKFGNMYEYDPSVKLVNPKSPESDVEWITDPRQRFVNGKIQTAELYNPKPTTEPATEPTIDPTMQEEYWTPNMYDDYYNSGLFKLGGKLHFLTNKL